jgi:hypothetical protein
LSKSMQAGEPARARDEAIVTAREQGLR